MSLPVTPTAEVQSRLDQAVLAKAVRLYALNEAPLGTHGELTEYGVATVRPDWNLQEILAGLIGVDWDTDLTTVDEADVIRALGYEEDAFPTGKTADVTRAISAARSWVASYIVGGPALA